MGTKEDSFRSARVLSMEEYKMPASSFKRINWENKCAEASVGGLLMNLALKGLY